MEVFKVMIRPTIFEYEDYRIYLDDMYHYLKLNLKPFSFRYFSRRAGFASPNFLKLVIEGKRNISLDSIPRFSQALKLTKVESEFFFHLVQFNQAKSPSEKSNCANRLLSSRGFQKIHPLKQAEYAYYANWYYIPVRELIAFKNFKENPHWISQTVFPAITPEQAKQALKDLETLGLIIRNSDGQLTQTQRTVTTPNEVSSSSIVRYHKDMMGKAADSIDSVPRDRREISAACVPVSKETALKIKKMIQDFRQEILAIAHEDQNPQTIYQINMQLFPVSSWEDEEPS